MDGYIEECRLLTSPTTVLTMPQQGTLRGIAVRGASRAPMQERQEVKVTVEQGIKGDYRGAGLRQVTFISVEQWQDTIKELDVDLPWHTRRANLLIDGIDLPDTVGEQIRMGDCLFTIYGERAVSAHGRTPIGATTGAEARPARRGLG